MISAISCAKVSATYINLSYILKPIRCIHNGLGFKSQFSRSFSTAMTFNRGFHTSLALKAKTFQEHENEYAHSIMESIPLYCNSIVKIDSLSKHRDLRDSSSDIVREFSKVTLEVSDSSISLENEKFSGLVTEISHSLTNLNEHDLINVLHNLCLWPPSPKSWSPNFKLLWNSIDYECCRRLSNWDIDQKLLIADYFFCLRLNRISQYNLNLIADLMDQINSMSNHHIVQLMFYINLQRKVPFLLNRTVIQRLQNLVELISINELGIVCLAFFKTETSVKDSRFIKAIIKRFVKELGQTNTATAAAILKFLKKSMCFELIEDYIQLLHQCVGQIPSWDVLTAVHSALLATECRVYHPLLLDTVTRHVTRHLSTEARIKDCVKVLQATSIFGHDADKCFRDMFFVETRKESRRSEIEKYKRDLVYAALFCAYLGHYDLQALKTVLDPSYVRDFWTRYSEMQPALAYLDYCVEIECPDYCGPRLSLERRNVLADRRGNLPTLPSANKNLQTRLILDSVSALKELGIKEENFLVRHILPHCFSPDIILRLSPSTTESLSEICSKIPPHNVLYPPYKNEQWICFVVASSFSFAYRSKKKTGVTEMRLRQLSKLGYRTVFLPYFDIPREKDRRLERFEQILKNLESECKPKSYNLKTQ